MGTYLYTAKDKAGKIVKGNVFALDRSSGIANVVARGLTLILLKEQSPKTGVLNLGFITKFKPGGKVKMADKVVFSRQFATMINAGVPVVQSLNILREQSSSKPMQAAVTDLAKRIEGGSTLAAALSEHPKIFDKVYVNMIKAGETGGILDQVLDRLAAQQEKDAEITGKVKSAMVYPAVITSVTVGAFVFLMTVIVPKLAVIFEGFGGQLPIYTRIMLGTSKLLTHYGFIIFGVLGGIIFGANRYIKTKQGKHIFDSVLINAPIFGKIIAKVNVARFARTFGSLMASGIPVLDALNTTAETLNNSLFRDELVRVASEVKNGKQIAAVMRTGKLFPPIVSQMVSVGEETGQLDTILIKLAEFYEKEVDAVVSSITSIIEPILIMVLGGMIGFIVISVFGPISQISNSV